MGSDGLYNARSASGTKSASTPDMPSKQGRTSAANRERRLEGEGSYSATRSYNKNLARALTDKRSIERGAEAARKAVEGPEARELRDAEKRGKAGPRSAAKRSVGSRR
jgi:hypothetical protein